MSSVRPVGPAPGFIRRVSDAMGAGLHRILGGTDVILSTDKAIDLRLRPIIIPAAALLLLLYLYGQKQIQGKDHPALDTLAELGKAAGGHSLVDTTRNVAPILGSAIALYQAGKQPNLNLKIQELVKMSILGGLGYAGILLGASYTFHQNKADGDFVHRLLRSDKDALLKLLNGSGPEFDVLRKSLPDLAKCLDDFKAVVARPAPPLYQAKEAFRLVQDKMAVVYEHLMAVDADEALQKKLVAFMARKNPALVRRFEQLTGKIRLGQSFSVQIARWGAPTFLCLLAFTLIGTPLANAVNGFINRHFRGLHRVKAHVGDPRPPNVEPPGFFGGGGHRMPSSWDLMRIPDPIR